MGSGKTNPLEDPVILAEEARTLLHAEDQAVTSALYAPLEREIKRAMGAVAADLARIDELQRAKKNVEIPYPSIFGAEIHEKVAALLFLCRHKLCDIANGPAQSKDIADARNELTTYVDILVRLNAVEAIGTLYDFAYSQYEATRQEFWQKVILYDLRLIAGMKEARARGIQFLKDRPLARRQVEQLMTSSDPAMAASFRAFGEDYVRARRETDPGAPGPAAPQYLLHYQTYDERLPEGQLAGLSSYLAAETRIRRAVETNDLKAVAAWLAEGSPRAVRFAVEQVRAHLPASSYVTALELVLQTPDLPVPSYATALVELGEINRALRPDGGEENVNRILVDTALTHESRLIGAALLAVHELRGANAFSDVVTVVEKAGIIAVAEEGIRMMCEMRRLTMVEGAVLRRPVLHTAFQRELKYLQTVQELVNAAWGATSEATGRVYLERLKDLNAVPELEQLGKKHRAVSELATRALAELRLGGTAARLR